MTPAAPDKVCSTTGLGLSRAHHQIGWRVARDQFVNAGGINHVLMNDRVGALVFGAPERRGRTLGRTVYFAGSKKAALAETLQAFRVDRLALSKDAVATGVDVEEYLRRVTEEAHDRGLPAAGTAAAVDGGTAAYRVGHL